MAVKDWRDGGRGEIWKGGRFAKEEGACRRGEEKKEERTGARLGGEKDEMEEDDR